MKKRYIALGAVTALGAYFYRHRVMYAMMLADSLADYLNGDNRLANQIVYTQQDHDFLSQPDWQAGSNDIPMPATFRCDNPKHTGLASPVIKFVAVLNAADTDVLMKAWHACIDGPPDSGYEVDRDTATGDLASTFQRYLDWQDNDGLTNFLWNLPRGLIDAFVAKISVSGAWYAMDDSDAAADLADHFIRLKSDDTPF